MARHGPKPWTTVKEDAFLKALLPEFIRARHLKMFVNFWADTFRSFFHQWPEHMRLHRNGVPAEGDLTPDQLKIVKLAIAERKLVIKPCLAHSGNSHGVLNLDDTFNGGVDELRGSRAPQEVEIYSQYHYETRVKSAADSAITMGGISSHGDKLSKRKEITRIMYAKEGDEICTEVKQKHEEVLAKWKHNRVLAKAGLVKEVDDDTKIQAFDELGSHLDRIFRHLSHKTGGLKFTCIAGGRNPSTGEVIVVDFHLGETDTGADFSASYPGFSDVQVAYADFVKKAVAHDDNMQSPVNKEASAQALGARKDMNECEDSNQDIFDDEDGNICDNEDGNICADEGNVCDDEDGQDTTIDLYNIPQEFTPVLDFSAGLQGIDLDTSEWFNLNVDHLYNESDTLLQFEELDPSVLGMDITNMIATLSNITDQNGAPSPLNALFEYPTAVASAPIPAQDLDYYQLAQFFQDLNLPDNGALEFTVPPPLLPVAALHYQLPDPSTVPGIRATTPLLQSTALQMLSP
ncbi:uncharacterized protein F5147DRAFT_780185 [Suillus discolor]|uniref:Uncharacterized protein n=1 Tax=Suillus discolor TaxID=1912936 RepID=A0A9P7EU54_9AGAM|nr:uncharacterized protein F5147DRAFT_780185 [Suillus discolor]KAG2090917.1 hypothetical protein F5147DRAFT_780185 [Suillus discolor]